MCCVNSYVILIHFEVTVLDYHIVFGPRNFLKGNVFVSVPVPYSDMLEVVSVLNTVGYSQAKPRSLHFFEGTVVFGHWGYETFVLRNNL